MRAVEHGMRRTITFHSFSCGPDHPTSDRFICFGDFGLTGTKSR